MEMFNCSAMRCAILLAKRFSSASVKSSFKGTSSLVSLSKTFPQLMRSQHWDHWLCLFSKAICSQGSGWPISIEDFVVLSPALYWVCSVNFTFLFRFCRLPLSTVLKLRDEYFLKLASMSPFCQWQVWLHADFRESENKLSETFPFHNPHLSYNKSSISQSPTFSSAFGAPFFHIFSIPIIAHLAAMHDQRASGTSLQICHRTHKLCADLESFSYKRMVENSARW